MNYIEFANYLEDVAGQIRVAGPIEEIKRREAEVVDSVTARALDKLKVYRRSLCVDRPKETLAVA